MYLKGKCRLWPGSMWKFSSKKSNFPNIQRIWPLCIPKALTTFNHVYGFWILQKSSPQRQRSGLQCGFVAVFIWINMNHNPILRPKCPNRQKSDFMGPGTVVSQGWGSLDLGKNFNLMFYDLNQDIHIFCQCIWKENVDSGQDQCENWAPKSQISQKYKGFYPYAFPKL